MTQPLDSGSLSNPHGSNVHGKVLHIYSSLVGRGRRGSSKRGDIVGRPEVHAEYAQGELSVHLWIVRWRGVSLAFWRTRDPVSVYINIAPAIAQGGQVGKRTEALASIGARLEVMLSRSEEGKADCAVGARMLVMVPWERMSARRRKRGTTYAGHSYSCSGGCNCQLGNHKGG